MNSSKSLLFWIALFAATLPPLFHHLVRTWQLEQYHYLPALALVVGLLISTRWNRSVEAPQKTTVIGLLVAGTLLLVLSFVLSSSWIGALGFVAFLGAFLISHHDLDGKSLGHIWPLTFLVMTLPLNLDTALTQWLQFKSSELSSYALDVIGISHVLFGNVIELPTGKLFVEQACSGVQSLFTVMFLSILMVVGFKRSPVLIPLYLLFAIVWAGAMNVLRIVAIAYSQTYFDFDLSHGYAHDVLGYVCLGLACLLLLSSDRLLRVLFYPISTKEEDGGEINPAVYLWNRFFYDAPKSKSGNAKKRKNSLLSRLGMPIGFSVERILYIAIPLSLVLFGSLGYRFLVPKGAQNELTIAARPVPFLEAPIAFKGLADWGFVPLEHAKTTGTKDQPFGENADIWRGTFKSIPVSIVLSQPYPEWHDLCVCQNAIGCQTNHREVKLLRDEGGKPWNLTSGRFISPNGKITYLWFSAMDKAGNLIQSPSGSLIQRWISRLTASNESLQQELENNPIAMIQLVVEVDSFLPPDLEKGLEELHLQSREELRKLLD